MLSVLELYEKLKPKLGEEEARSLLEYVESAVERRAATKADLELTAAQLREEIQRFDAGLREEIQRLRQEVQGVDAGLHQQIQRFDASLREEIQRARQEMQAMKAELIKWSFLFWVGAVGALSGIMYTLMRNLASR